MASYRALFSSVTISADVSAMADAWPREQHVAQVSGNVVTAACTAQVRRIARAERHDAPHTACMRRPTCSVWLALLHSCAPSVCRLCKRASFCAAAALTTSVTATTVSAASSEPPPPAEVPAVPSTDASAPAASLVVVLAGTAFGATLSVAASSTVAPGGGTGAGTGSGAAAVAAAASSAFSSMGVATVSCDAPAVPETASVSAALPRGDDMATAEESTASGGKDAKWPATRLRLCCQRVSSGCWRILVGLCVSGGCGGRGSRSGASSGVACHTTEIGW